MHVIPHSLTFSRDFGISIHEGQPSQAPYDATINVFTFRYVLEPFSMWIPLSDALLNYSSNSDVLAFLQQNANNASSRIKQDAQVVLTSGLYDVNGNLVYSYNPRPWCSGE